MTVREQLIEILRKPIFPHELADPTEAVADYLLDNGVTIQRWIPVTERLPDHNNSVMVYCENLTIQGGYVVHIGSCDIVSGTPFWFLCTQPGVQSFPNHDWRVTHWMPLPQAPGKEGA